MKNNKNERKKVTVLVVIIILLSSTFIGFDTADFSEVRNIDLAKIFACGMLTGVLIVLIKDMVLERKAS